MDKDLIVSRTPEGVQIALLEDKRLVELHREQPGGQYAVGDIYFGKVRKIMQGLNAAFIDVGATSAPTTTLWTNTCAWP